ncbi:MAG: ribosome-associated translation inhibitor RaiA [Romboutsia sp.]
MKIIISGKQMELTDAIKSAIEEKIGRLEYYIHPETEVKVTVRAKKARQTVEVTIVPISGPIIRAEDSEESLYAAIDVVYDKLNRQLRRYKNRLQDKYQSNKSIRFNDGIENVDTIEDDDFNESEIVIERRKKFDMKPMSAEEAVLQMELVEHEFYMFRNIDTDEISIVYKRINGGYGMIEHE